MLHHRLLLLRHAQATDYAPGLEDHERPLTDHGLEQATTVGSALRARAVKIDQVICSSATRTRQTWQALGLDAPVDYTDDIYNAAGDTILERIRLTDEQAGSIMIVGHGPGLPSLAAQLAGPGSDQRAVDVLKNGYPVATISDFDVDGPWSELQLARLTWLRLGQ